MTTLTLVAGAPPRDRLEWAAVAGLLGFVSALQLSIAAAGIFLAVTLTCWAGALVLGQERWDAPRFFWPLLFYAAWTLISAAGSPDPRTSFVDSKQLVVFLLVPAVYQLARGNRALTSSSRSAPPARFSASSSTGCSTTTTSGNAPRARWDTT